MEASGAISPDGARFEIALEAKNAVFGKTAAGAPFHVYTPAKFRNDAKLRTRAYAVAAGDRVTDAWELAGFENGAYRLHVCGPNGFLREFAGSAKDPKVEVRCEYSKEGNALTGDLELRAVNHAARPLTIEVKDHGYKGANHSLTIQPSAERALALRLGQSHHWYDFSVTVAGEGGFLRRFAGRVETGKSGFSDPVMGGAGG